MRDPCENHFNYDRLFAASDLPKQLACDDARNLAGMPFVGQASFAKFFKLALMVNR